MEDRKELEERVRRLEDILSLHSLLTCYGLAADTGDAESLSAMFTDDAVYELDELRLEGRDQIVATIIDRRKQIQMLASAHTIGPVVVTVEGDRATACGYSRLYGLEEDDTVTLWRLSFNRWEFVRKDHRWLIAQRITRALGHKDAPELLRTLRG